MKILMLPNSSGSRWWRLQDPAKYMRRKGGFDVQISTDKLTEDMVKWADVVVTQGIVDKEGIALLYAYQQECGKKIVVEQDDQIEVDASNPHKREHEISNAKEVVSKTIEIADMVTTTTEYLARKLSKLNKNVVVLPNYMDMERWDLKKNINTSDRIRIGWAGSITHLEDLKMVLPVLHRIQNEFPKVQYVFVGEPRIRQYLDGLNAEIMLGTPFEAWASKLHSLRLDIAIAPLVDNEFNRCKSNIKSLEYGIAQYAGVYSKVIYGEKNFDGVRGETAENDEQWYLCIKNLIIAPFLRREIVSRAYAHTRQWDNLEKNIDLWIDAYNSLTVTRKTK